MISTCRKWKAVFTVFFQDGVTYAAAGLIWILTDVVTAVTMPLVWAGAARTGAIKGYSAGDFVLYYLCLLLLQGFVVCHIQWDLAVDIREGRFTPTLLRPISVYQFNFFRNLPWRFLRVILFAPMFLFMLFCYRDMLVGAHVHLTWQFWVSLLLGHLVSFTTVMMMATLALFVQEVYSIFELYYLPALFLSGQLFPIAVMPHWIQVLSNFFPFYYTVGAPTSILVGRISGDAVLPVLGMQVLWVVITYGVGKVLLARGLRYYSAVGM
jgi:ABC-2 type transport system permease protein